MLICYNEITVSNPKEAYNMVNYIELDSLIKRLKEDASNWGTDRKTEKNHVKQIST